MQLPVHPPMQPPIPTGRASPAFSVDESIAQDKQSVLEELDRQGGRGALSEAHDLADLEHELSRRHVESEAEGVTNTALKLINLACFGIEMANERAGPVLNLRGWSRYQRQRNDELKPVIKRCYSRYWRAGSVPPALELGIMLGSSAFDYHTSGGALEAARTEPPAPQTSAPQTPASTSASMSNPSAARPPMRVPMRAPMRVPPLAGSPPANVGQQPARGRAMQDDVLTVIPEDDASDASEVPSERDDIEAALDAEISDEEDDGALQAPRTSRGSGASSSRSTGSRGSPINLGAI